LRRKKKGEEKTIPLSESPILAISSAHVIGPRKERGKEEKLPEKGEVENKDCRCRPSSASILTWIPKKKERSKGGKKKRRPKCHRRSAKSNKPF